MTKNLLKQYEEVLKIIETQDWVTKEMVFDILNIDSKEEMEKLLKMSLDEMEKYFKEKKQV